MTDSWQHDGARSRKLLCAACPHGVRAKFLQRALDGWNVSRAIVNDRHVHSNSFVLGRTFFNRLSRATANRSARANALKIASTWWCEDRPYRHRKCTFAHAEDAKPPKKSSSSSAWKSP